jgi:hypothetical protein
MTTSNSPLPVGAICIQFSELLQAIEWAEPNGGRIWRGDNGTIAWFSMNVTPTDCMLHPICRGNGHLAGHDEFRRIYDGVAAALNKSA